MSMSISRIPVTHALSLRDYINLENTSNILLGSEAHISHFLDIIIEKTLAGRGVEAEIHLRFADQQFLRSELELIKRLISNGVEIYVWLTEEEAESIQPDHNIVIIKRTYPIAAENFLIAATRTDARSLIWWKPANRSTEPGKKQQEVAGLLITYPDETRRLMAHLQAALHP